MIRLTLPLTLATVIFLLSSCENRDVSYTDGPNFNDIHGGTYDYFDSVAIDGCIYLILERDRNNPHEGFGFMALKGNDIKNNQDSIKALLKTILDFQVKQMAKQNNTSEEEVRTYSNELYDYYFKQSTSPFHKNKAE